MNEKELFQVVRECFELGSLPLIEEGCFKVRCLKFFYSNHGTETLRINIMHPDTDELEVVFLCRDKFISDPRAHWDLGPWDQMLEDCLTSIKAANDRKKQELYDLRAKIAVNTRIKLNLLKLNLLRQKFVDLFDNV
jgi:hypothetical protein